MLIAGVETIIVGTALFCCRHIFGYLFSNDKQIVNCLAEMIPLLCISVILDSIQAVLSGQYLTCSALTETAYMAKLLGVITFLKGGKLGSSVCLGRVKGGLFEHMPYLPIY